MSLSRISTAALAAAMAIAPVQASPIFVGSAPHASGVTHAQWHGRGWGYDRGWGYGRGYGRGGWGGAWPFIGFGAAVIAGAIIADQAYRPHPGHYYVKVPTTGLTIIPRTSAETRARYACRISAPSSGAPASTPPTPARSDCAPT
jgi:hypothetical protein